MVKTPWAIRKLFPHLLWKIPTREKTLYLTFDDGPHPVATPFVLEQLAHFNAKATFQSLVENAKIEEIRVQAEQRLDEVKKEEEANSKVSNPN